MCQLAEGNQLAIYKRGRGFQLVTSKNKSKVARAGLQPGTSGLRVRRADHLKEKKGSTGRVKRGGDETKKFMITINGDGNTRAF